MTVIGCLSACHGGADAVASNEGQGSASEVSGLVNDSSRSPLPPVMVIEEEVPVPHATPTEDTTEVVISGRPLEQVSQILRASVTEAYRTPDTEDGPLDILWYSYEEAEEWPHSGEGFAVLGSDQETVVWEFHQDSWVWPKRLQWADFDADGTDDLFVEWASEEMAGAWVFLNRVAGDTYTKSSFESSFEGTNAVAVDLNADGYPELLIGEFFERENPFSACHPWGAELRSEWDAEYVRLGGDSDSQGNGRRLQVRSRIEPRYFYADSIWDAAAYGDHIMWRVDVLERMQEGQPPECVSALQQRQEFLQAELGRGEPPA